MNQRTKAGLVSLVVFVLLGAPLWALLPAEATTVAPYIPVLVAVTVLAGLLVVHGERFADRPRVTGPGARER